MPLLNNTQSCQGWDKIPRIVGDCGKAGRENGATECSNIGESKGTYDAVKLEKGEKSPAVRSYSDDTREDLQTPLGQNRLIIT